jgi:hypothetical protein
MIKKNKKKQNLIGLRTSQQYLNEISRPGRVINQDYRSYICDLQLPDNVKKDILRDLDKPIRYCY